MRQLALAIALLLVSSASPAPAQRLPAKDVPPPLQGWVGWALDTAGDAVCPRLKSSPVCIWPGQLTLDLVAAGGRFVQPFEAERPGWATLPGGARLWPVEVRLDGTAAPVLEVAGRPSLWLSRGAHRVEGRFVWTRLPDSLPVPPSTGLVDLAVDGRTVRLPRRETGGDLLLRQGGGGDSEPEAIRVKVFRRLRDDVPMWLDTHILLEVSGRAREVRLLGGLVPGTRPVALGGSLPARLDGDGSLRVQARSGSFVVTVLARTDSTPAELRVPGGAPPWPDEEVWTVLRDEQLRQLEVTGATPIDPSRTELPQAWSELPAYLLTPGATLALSESRRGQPQPPPDSVHINRSLWLDLDGRGFAFRDTLRGTLARITRLDMLPPAVLERVENSREAQLITTDPESGRPGVELRTTELAGDTVAEGHVPRHGFDVGVGWNVEVSELALLLNLPPGWRLFAAPGAAEAPASWLGRWSLATVLIVILLAAVVAGVSGWRWGLLAILTLLLCWQDVGWWRWALAALILASGIRASTTGQRTAGISRKLAATAALVAIAGSVVVFTEQLRLGMFPTTQVADPRIMDRLARAGSGGIGAVGEAPNLPSGSPLQSAVQEPPRTAGYYLQATPSPRRTPGLAFKLQQQVVNATQGDTDKSKTDAYANTFATSVITTVPRAYDPDPNALVQTGSGLPSWGWSQEFLRYTGPRPGAQPITLVLLSPAANLALVLIRIAMVVVLMGHLVAPIRPTVVRSQAAGAAATALLLLLLLGGTAAAQTPPPQSQLPATTTGNDPGVPGPDLLTELGTRITREAPCGKDCVDTSALRVEATGDELRLTAQVHAGATVGWTIPGPAASWVPRTVRVDGRGDVAVVRLDDDFLRLRLPEGVHTVELAGPLPDTPSLTLLLGGRPRHVSVSVSGWTLDGVREDGTSDGALQLSRLLAPRAAAAVGQEVRLQPWFRVIRVLDIGVSWRVETIVRRVTPAGAPAFLKVPLLQGMLTTGEQQVSDGQVIVTFGRDQLESRFTSTLPPTDDTPVTLQAPTGQPWSEDWVLHCGQAWQCRASGLVPTSRQAEGMHVLEFRPWPGERLDLTFARPHGVTGRTITLDGLTLSVAPHNLVADGVLNATSRASRAGTLVVTLPPGAEVRSLQSSGRALPYEPDRNVQSLLVKPGRQAFSATWRQPVGSLAVLRLPRVALDQPAANCALDLTVPEDRWVVLTWGPAWGPTVGLWWRLLLLVIGASVLAAWAAAPLLRRDWLLLAAGLVVLPPVMAVVVGGWFLAMAWRERTTVTTPGRHDLVQVGLVAWTLAMLCVLLGAAAVGLALPPVSLVAGNGSTDRVLHWYVDRIAGPTPTAGCLTLPEWSYRALWLAWALWLVWRLRHWLPWGWRCFAAGGAWLQPITRRTRTEPPGESG